MTTPEDISYDPDFFEFLYRMEDTDFWFRHRNRIIRCEVSRAIRLCDPGYAVLEVGCGTGYVLRMLQNTCLGARVMGIDPHAEALRFARRRASCAMAQTDIAAWQTNDRFSIIGCFDVLEHIDDDVLALRKMFQLLLPGGTLLVTVPAFPALWNDSDDKAHHMRRYRRLEMQEKMETAGFSVTYVTHFMLLLCPVTWLSSQVRRSICRSPCRQISEAERFFPGQGTLRFSRLAGTCAEWALSLEIPLVRSRMVLPFGTSILAVARRPCGPH